MFGARTDLSGSKLSESWWRLVRDVDSNQQLYWITADISDAFGTIRLSKLVEIIKHCQKTLHPNDKYYIKKTEDLCRSLYLSIGTFHIGAKKKYFMLKKGIMQGDPLSPFLSDIYYDSWLNMK